MFTFTRAAGSALVVVLGVAGVAMEPAAAQDLLWTTHNSASFVSVIDPGTQIVQTVDVGGGNNGIAASPDGSEVYVVVSNVGVKIIDTATLTVVDTIPVTGLVFGVRLSPDGSTAYVTRGNPANIFVIDTASRTITDTLFPVSNAVYLDISPDGSRLYVSTSRISPTIETMLTVVDTQTLDMNAIDVQRYPAEIAVSPDGAWVYMSNEFNASVTVLDAATNTVAGTIAVGNQPRGITFNQSGTLAYVMNASSGTVSVIDTALRQVVDTIDVAAGFPMAMSILPGGGAFVTRWSASALARVDLGAGAVQGNIPLGARPYLVMALAADEPCYANCDHSTVAPALNVDDFTCFINEFAAAQALPHEQQVSHYANCDSSTIAPALNVDDFTCFINAFAQGCP